MRITETTPLLGEPSSSRPQRPHVANPNRPNYMLCPHAPSHYFHIKIVVPGSATDGNQGRSSNRHLPVIPEGDEEADSPSEESDDSITGLSSSNMGTDSSDEVLDVPQEQPVYFTPVMVPIVVHPRMEQTLEEEDTWEVGCVSRFCWPFMWLIRKLDNAPDEQDNPRPAPQSEAEDSDAEFADDEHSSSESSVRSVDPSTDSPHMALLMPAVRVYGYSSQ